MIYHDIPWCYRVLQGKVCIIPVSKHHGILPWFPCFETPWYFTMVSLFPNTMVFYHGFPVSKHHGILPWFICTGTRTRTRTRRHAHMQTHMHAHIITLHTHSRRNERKHARTHARTHFSPMHVVKANSRSGLFVSSRFTPAATIVVCLSYWKDKSRNDAV